MNYFTRTYSLMKIAFHSHQIQHYRLQGQKLMHNSTSELTSPQLISLTQRIDHHGCLLRQLEQRLVQKQ